MPITAQQLLQILPNAGQKAGVFAPVLNTAMSKYQIATQLRIAAFIAQVGHESGQLTVTVENLNYSAKGLQATWPKRFDATSAAEYARQPERIANVVYGSRLGNTAPGDGWKYRGRGLIQVTGKANYEACAEALGLDLINHPELLELAQHAAMSAAWFWHQAALNTLADKGDFLTITRRINGGTNGLADRQALYARALEVLA
ncbi:glycoside hydrolase family 19 protein [Pseudomonas syringae]|uniref:glycoside hydrolase family 19 protein n=1 Tax=Pseudomonas syringae TaxID=317 RepID=UPI0006CB3655|nr:glycoside hydrolase family 19 protein [Pseudomonas syringae]ALD96241.1 pyocin R, lytic enzyme [Pseudomonas syringae UMAF0158]MCK9732238.1 glycoside hydrolase family 19 protein [Pseudomonas syringae pv. syringae]